MVFFLSYNIHCLKLFSPDDAFMTVDMLRCYWLLVFMAPLSDYVWSLKPCPGDTRGDRSVIIIIVIMSSLLLSNSP